MKKWVYDVEEQNLKDLRLVKRISMFLLSSAKLVLTNVRLLSSLLIVEFWQGGEGAVTCGKE